MGVSDSSVARPASPLSPILPLKPSMETRPASPPSLVLPPKPPTLELAGWAPAMEWKESKRTELLGEIEHFTTETDSIPKANILVVGAVGAGKSSAINTLTSVLKGRIVIATEAGSNGHSFTSQYKILKVRGSKKQQLQFRVHDTPGLEEDLGLNVSDLPYIFDGHVPHKHTFNPLKAISMSTDGIKKDPKPKDKIHCMCIIIDGTTVDAMSEKISAKIKAIRMCAVERDVSVIVALTKVDKICADVDRDLSTVYYSQKILKVVDKVSQKYGIPRNRIHPLKNYESETSLTTLVDILALNTLHHMLFACQDYMDNLMNDDLSD